MSIVGNAITLGGGSPADLITKSITANGTYTASDDSADGYSQVTVAVPEDVLTTKTITANDTYNASDDSADGYSSVTVNVPNSYSASDEGKVVSNSALVSQTSTTKTANGTYDTTLNNEVVVDVDANVGAKTITANGTYTASTESLDGYSEVTVNVSGGGSTLVSKSITANGNYDPQDDNADGYSAIAVNVPNSYSASDEGKVVSGGALVTQTPTTVTANGTYDTTENDEVVVNVSGGGSTLVSKTITANGVYDPADDSADGYSSVTVNVPTSGLTQIDPFNGTIALVDSNGVTLDNYSIAADYTADINLISASAGFEGFNIALNNLIVDTTYLLEFDWQLTSGSYFTTHTAYSNKMDSFTVGFLITNASKSDYSDFREWPNNIIRDTSAHTYAAIFTATATTMYLSANVCGYSDSTTNYFDITDLQLFSM